MSETIEAVNGKVRIDIGDGYEREPFDYTPAQAREFAARIASEADKCDVQRQAIEAACAGGHDWGVGCNGYLQWPRKVSFYSCQREGCDGRKTEDGWMEFAGRLHVRMGQRVDCYGPGCDRCAEEAIGKAVRESFAATTKRLDELMLGERTSV